MGDFAKGNIAKRKEKPFKPNEDSHIPLLNESSTKIEYLEDGSKLKYDAVSAEQLFQVLEMQSGSSTAVNVMGKLLPNQNGKSGRPEIINSLLLRPDSIKKISKTELVEQISSSTRRPKIIPYKIVKNKDSFGRTRSSSRQSSRKQKKQSCEDNFDEIPDPGQLPYESGELDLEITPANHLEEAIQSERDPEGEEQKCEGDSIENISPQEINGVTFRVEHSPTVKKPTKYLNKNHSNEIPDPDQPPHNVSESTLRITSENSMEEAIQNGKNFDFFEIKMSPRKPLNITYNVARSRDIFRKSKSPNRQTVRKPKTNHQREEYMNDMTDNGKLSYKTGKPTSRITPNNYMEGSRDLDGDCIKVENDDCIDIRNSLLTPKAAKNTSDIKDLVVKTESDDSIELKRYISVERVGNHLEDLNRTRTLCRWPANMRASIAADKLGQQVYAFVRHALEEISDNSNPINAPRAAPVMPNIAGCLWKPIDKLPVTVSDERIATAPKMAAIIPAPPKGKRILFDLDEYVFPRQEDLNRLNLHHFGRPSMDENLNEELRKRTLLLIKYAQELLNEFDRRQVENEKYWAQRSNEESNLVSYLDPAPPRGGPHSLYAECFV